MTDHLEFVKIITSWKDHDKKKIVDVLKRIDTLNFNKQPIFDPVNKAIMNFHKQIQNADRNIIDSQWFATVIKIKKKLKKISQTKKQEKPPSLKKISSVIQYPDILFESVRENQHNIVKVLWKNFSSNLQQQHTKNPKAIQFIKEVNSEIRKIFEDQLDTKKQKRIDSICMHLGRQSSTLAKIQMIQGKKNPKLIAQDNDSAFRDEQTQKRHEQLLKEQFQLSQLGFYDNMKKNIFSGAAQECRFCKKPSAYCDDMKQIRASDQPMTRFMKCNNCNKNWRD